MAQIYVAGEQIGIDIYQDDLEDCFSKYGRLNNIWVARQPPGFAFITFDDSRDADDAVDGEDGRYLRDSRLRVERSRNKGGGKGKGGGGGYGDRGARSGAPQRTDHRVRVTGLSRGANWRDIKDFLREGGAVTYADVGRDGEGVAEFATRDDMEDAIYKLDGTKFRGERVKIEKESREYDFRRDGRTGREGADDRGGGHGGGDRYGDRRGGRDASRSRSRDRGRDRGGDRDRRRDDDDRSKSPKKEEAGERGRRRDDDDDRGRDRDRDRDRRRGDDDDRDRRRDESPPRKDEDAKKSPARSASRSRSPARRDDDGDRSPRSDRD